MFKGFITVVVGIFFAIKLNGQAGLIVYGGPSVAFSSDKVITAQGEAHYGYVVGANARLNSDNLYFLLSAEYGEFDFISSNNVSIIGGDNLRYLKPKIGLGFNLFRFTSKSAIYSKIQGNLLSVLRINEDWLNNSRYVNSGYNTEINDGIAGLSSGLGLNLGNFHLEVEYEYGLFNIIKTKKTSKLNFVNLTAGYRL